MKFQNITVSGIDNIVIDHKVQWQRVGVVWNTVEKGKQVSHEGMMNIVAYLKEDRRYRMWVHGDTLNIVRK